MSATITSIFSKLKTSIFVHRNLSPFQIGVFRLNSNDSYPDNVIQNWKDNTAVVKRDPYKYHRPYKGTKSLYRNPLPHSEKRALGNKGPNTYAGKALQEWEDWDGYGPYKYRHHFYPDNRVLKDVQKRRIFAKTHEERTRINCIRKNDILPQELRTLADEEVVKLPRNSALTHLNRRCTVTGRPRGIFHQFRVSRMIFRQEADYNKVSGVMKAKWMVSTHIKP